MTVLRRYIRCFQAILVTFLSVTTTPMLARAQSLRGSSRAVKAAYDVACDEGLTFVKTPADVAQLVKEGRLVKLEPSSVVSLHRVSFPVALPEVVTFVERLAAGYRKGCGEELVVTSLTRPLSRQPKNASSRSVHPAGMAVDIRRSKLKKCRDWLEEVLLDLEGAGVVEATEEHHPPHYHVAVFPTKYKAYVDRLDKGVAPESGAGEGGESGWYVVQTGDSLWTIARRFGTTVERLKVLNDLSSEHIEAGRRLRLPQPEKGIESSKQTQNGSEQ